MALSDNLGVPEVALGPRRHFQAWNSLVLPRSIARRIPPLLLRISPKGILLPRSIVRRIPPFLLRIFLKDTSDDEDLSEGSTSSSPSNSIPGIV